MSETLILKLAQYIINSATSGVIGDLTYESLKGWWDSRRSETLEDIYTDEFVKAADGLAPALQHYSDGTADVSIDKVILRQIFAGDAPSMPLVDGTLESLLDTLANRLVEGQVVIIPGHQLTDVDYKGLMLEVLQRTWKRINQEISENEVLFKEYVRQATKLANVKDDEILNTLDQVNKHFDQLIFAENEILRRELAHLSQEHQQILSLLLRTDREKSPQLNFMTLKAICSNQVRHSVKQAVGQYISERYVYRFDVESEFSSKFLKDNKPCYLVLGRAGEGKTNVLCHLAETNLPSLLFLSGREFTYDGSIEAHLLDIVMGRDTDLRFAEFVKLVNQLLQENSTYLLVFIDAINDNSDSSMLNNAISGFIVNIRGSRIKVIFSCRDTDWSYFHENNVLRQGLFNPVHGQLNLRSIERASISLFSDDELDAAWNVYKAFYLLQGNLTNELRSLCRDPFMLYLLGEAYSNRNIDIDQNAYTLPEHSTRLQLFNKYWERKFPQHLKYMQHAVYSLVKNRRENSLYGEFTSFEIVDLLKTSPDPYQIYHSLLSEKILVATGEESAKFTYDLVFEYSSARQYIFQEYGLDRKSDEQIIDALNQFLSRNLRANFLRQGHLLNMISFVLAILIIDYGRNELFAKLFESNLRGQIEVPLCTVIEQLPSIQEPEIFKVLELISIEDKSPDIQFILAQMLGNARQRTSQLSAISLLRNLTTSREELVRLQVIESLEKLAISVPNETISVLLKLVDDHELESIRPSARRLLWKILFGLSKNEQSNILQSLLQDAREYIRTKAQKFITLNDESMSMEKLIHLIDDKDRDISRKALTIFWERAPYLSEAELLRLVPQILDEVGDYHQNELRQYIRRFLDSLILHSQCFKLLPLVQKGDVKVQEFIREILSQTNIESPSIDFLILKLQTYTPYPVDELINRAVLFSESHWNNIDAHPGMSVVEFSQQVAMILVELGSDPSIVVASLLLGDLRPEAIQEVRNNIAASFGNEVLKIIEETIKIAQLELWTLNEKDRQLVQEMHLAILEDSRSALIFLVCRLVKLKALSGIATTEIRAIANRTLDVYAPLASIFGYWKIRDELEDQAFRCLEPDNFLQADRTKNEIIGGIRNRLKALSKSNVPYQILNYRLNAYGIHRYYKGGSSSGIANYYTAIIITDTVTSCYRLLSILHTVFRFDPQEFRDFISSPRDGGYQSLDTTVFDFGGRKIRFLIRTKEMHQQALDEIGYEVGSNDDSSFGLIRKHRDAEYVHKLKQSIYVFSPGSKGGILKLPIGSTPIDFAYYIHTDLGHCCRGARVNGKLVPLYHELKTGDYVDILTTKRGGPSRDWLNSSLGLVKTQRAKSKIRLWFKKEEYKQNLSQGRLLLERELRRLGIAETNFEKMARDLGFKKPDEMFVALGSGKLLVNKLIREISQADEITNLLTLSPLLPKEVKTEDAVSVVGLKGLLTTMGKCCNPAPGDQIVGYITRGRGATIHRQDCPNILRLDNRDRKRLVHVTWGDQTQTYPVPIRIRAYDRQGLMNDVSNLLSDESVNIADLKITVNRSLIELRLIVEIQDVAQLSKVLTKLENVPNVIEVHRVSG